MHRHNTVAVQGRFKGKPAQTYHIPMHEEHVGVCHVLDRKTRRALLLYLNASGVWEQLGEVASEKAVAWCDVVWSLTHCLREDGVCGPGAERGMLERLRYMINGSPEPIEVEL